MAKRVVSRSRVSARVKAQPARARARASLLGAVSAACEQT